MNFKVSREMLSLAFKELSLVSYLEIHFQHSSGEEALEHSNRECLISLTTELRSLNLDLPTVT